MHQFIQWTRLSFRRINRLQENETYLSFMSQIGMSKKSFIFHQSEKTSLISARRTRMIREESAFAQVLSTVFHLAVFRRWKWLRVVESPRGFQNDLQLRRSNEKTSLCVPAGPERERLSSWSRSFQQSDPFPDFPFVQKEDIRSRISPLIDVRRLFCGIYIRCVKLSTMCHQYSWDANGCINQLTLINVAYIDPLLADG